MDSYVSCRVWWEGVHLKVMFYIWVTDSPVKNELPSTSVPVWEWWKWKIIAAQESLNKNAPGFTSGSQEILFKSWLVSTLAELCMLASLTIQNNLQKPWHWSILSQLMHIWPCPMLNSRRVYNRLTCPIVTIKKKKVKNVDPLTTSFKFNHNYCEIHHEFIWKHQPHF